MAIVFHGHLGLGYVAGNTASSGGIRHIGDTAPRYVRYDKTVVRDYTTAIIFTLEPI